MTVALFPPEPDSEQEKKMWEEEITRRVNVANQASSTATAVGDLTNDFNALLAKLKAAGIMLG